jgi:hypothetical protein
MQTTPGHATPHPRRIHQEPGRHREAQLAPLTPAERIALTIALLNRGLDLVDGFARTSLAECTRGVFRGHHDPERERRLPRIT